MATKEISLNYEMDEVPWVGGGDADVCTKGNRKTAVKVDVDTLRVSTDNNYVLARVVYDIREKHKDYTHLRGEDTVEIPIEYGYEDATVKVVKTEDYHYRRVFIGKNHRWNKISPGSAKSCIRSGSVKFDGKGRDDRGNARLKLRLRAWVDIT